LDLQRLRALMAMPVMVDLRNVYRGEDVVKEGMAYSSVGRERHLVR
jgi:UDPglucose 6-dehydrogenase